MIKSMTGFSRLEITKGKITVSVEIRTYNSRHLDIVLKNSYKYISVEDRIKNLISGKIARGRLELSLEINDELDESYTYALNTPKAKAYHEALRELKNKCDIDTEIALELLVHAGDIITPVEKETDLNNYWPVIEDCVKKGIDSLNDMRLKEGKYIAEDINDRIDFIDQSIIQIKDQTKDILIQYQDRLKERINTLTNGIVDIDPDRIAQEAAFLADKSDISEEIVRALSHLKQFQSIMASDEPGGRKLNFLLQEFNREFNTMGSKVGKAHVSHIIVDVKSELEKIREQVQNIE